MQRSRMLSIALLVATLPLLAATYGVLPATAGESKPNVTGKWEGSWTHQAGSGQATFQLV